MPAFGKEHKSFTILDKIMSYDYAFIFPKDESSEKLADQMNEYIKKISSDGTMDKIKEKWYSTNEAA